MGLIDWLQWFALLAVTLGQIYFFVRAWRSNNELEECLEALTDEVEHLSDEQKQLDASLSQHTAQQTKDGDTAVVENTQDSTNTS